MRVMNGLMAVLFAFAVVVQFNDPDPGRWVAIYGAATVVCGIAAWRGRVAIVAPVAVCAAAGVWGLWTAAGGPGRLAYVHMFDSWEMKSFGSEEAREASGLLMVAMWMAVVTLTQRRSAQRHSGETR